MNLHNAYTALLMRHRKMLWRMCWHWTGGDHDRCCDMLQEVSLALWENFEKLRPDATPGQERSWVRWQTRSVLYQFGRKQKPPTVPISDSLSNSYTDEDAQHRKELLDDLLSTLDPDDQRLIRLYLEGYHGDEIGKKMGISRDNYYQRLHRAIQKMRRIALVLLALLFVSAVAIALVPQWRHLFFDNDKPEESVTDSISKPPDVAPTVTPLHDTLATPPTVKRDTLHKIEPLERMSPLNLSDLMTYSEELPTPEKRDSLTLLVNGTSITVPGSEGERIRIYDMSGRLVYTQKARNLCVIDLLPVNNIYFCRWSYQFYLNIGNRPALILTL